MLPFACEYNAWSLQGFRQAILLQGRWLWTPHPHASGLRPRIFQLNKELGHKTDGKMTKRLVQKLEPAIIIAVVAGGRRMKERGRVEYFCLFFKKKGEKNMS